VLALTGWPITADNLFTFTQVTPARGVAQLDCRGVHVLVAPILARVDPASPNNISRGSQMFQVAPAKAEDVQRAMRLSRVRGLLLGLALGDALASDKQFERGTFYATVTTQLASFTTEGLIRMWVRGDHKGIGPALGVVWNAYRRWAMIQGIDLGRNTHELDVWLCEVPALAERRGNAPAIVTALKAADGVQVVPAPAISRGHHALTRLLPAAAVPWLREEQVRQLASSAHGSATAIEAAVVGVVLARAALTASSLREAIEQIDSSPLLDGVLDPEVPLDKLGRSHSARSALRGGVAIAARCPDGSPAAVHFALREAREAGVPAAVGPVAGALLGALYGVEALSTNLVGRLELGWVVDTLARDLVSQDLDHPGGFEFSEAPDPDWMDRYPGW
jgi:ADP-ribosylglycohydrolase